MPSHEFVPASPGSWPRTWRIGMETHVAAHEAAHATAAVLLGFRLSEVRIDNPDYGIAGLVRRERMRRIEDPHRLRRVAERSMALTLAGPMWAEGISGVDWFMPGDSPYEDQTKYSEILHLIDRDAWDQAHLKVRRCTEELLALEAFQRACGRVTNELQRRGALPGAEARDLVMQEAGAVWGAHGWDGDG